MPLAIKVPAYLMDHQFRGRAVLPAVEAMEILAASTVHQLPEVAILSVWDGKFDKFLPIQEAGRPINAFNDLEILDNGTVVSRLATKTKSKKARIIRTLEHATLCFHGRSNGPEPPPLESPSASDYHVTAESIYEHLVPFGPSYHNLIDGVTVSEKGATGRVYGPSLVHNERLLGSPFPLDAAFHAACVWGQRYAGLVGFPVGFGLRRVFMPTRSGNTYTASIIPKAVHPDRFLVDIWITGTDGAVHEVVSHVVMKDVSGGRVKPPSWIVKQDANNLYKNSL